MTPLGIRSEELLLFALIAAPAVFGLLAFVFGIVLLTKQRTSGTKERWRQIAGVVLLLGGLGVGACYGLLFLGNGLH